MALNEIGMRQFYKMVGRHPQALVRLLSLYVAGEERSEIGPLLLLIKALPDCDLRDKLKRHLKDEGRHSGVFRARIKDLGGEVYPIPSELEAVEHFRAGTDMGRVFDMPAEMVVQRKQVIDILLFNSVIEEFVLGNFMAHADAAGSSDPRTYFMLMDVIADEVRHVIYTNEQAYIIAGTDLLGHARRRQAELEQVRMQLAPMLFGLMVKLLIDDPATGIPLRERLLWRTLAKMTQNRRLEPPSIVPKVNASLMVTASAPWGHNEHISTGRMTNPLQPKTQVKNQASAN